MNYTFHPEAKAELNEAIMQLNRKPGYWKDRVR